MSLNQNCQVKIIQPCGKWGHHRYDRQHLYPDHWRIQQWWTLPKTGEPRGPTKPEPLDLHLAQSHDNDHPCDYGNWPITLEEMLPWQKREWYHQQLLHYISTTPANHDQPDGRPCHCQAHLGSKEDQTISHFCTFSLFLSNVFQTAQTLGEICDNDFCINYQYLLLSKHSLPTI